MNFRGSLQPMPCRSWIGETSPKPDFVRPVEVFQGFFDIAHPCRRDESVIERSTVIQKLFEKINQIFIEKSIRNRQNIRSAPRLREKRIRTRHGGAPRTLQGSFGPHGAFEWFFREVWAQTRYFDDF